MRSSLPAIIWCSLLVLSACQREHDTLLSHGDYLGQPPPGDEPEVFAPGIISHGFHEHALTIAADGSEIFYGTSSRDHRHYTIVRVARVGGTWRSPEIASFADDGDMAPRFSPDGARLFFSSRRHGRPDFDIYVVERTGESWGDPVNLGSPVNTDANEFAPAVAADGTLYFQYWEEDGSRSDIYVARLEGGAYQAATRLAFGISAEGYDGGPYVAPDQRYLLFQSVRATNVGEGNTEMYVSIRSGDGTWGTPANLGHQVNASCNPIHPVLSADERYLFFGCNSVRVRDRSFSRSYDSLMLQYREPGNGSGTLYWVDAGSVPALQDVLGARRTRRPPDDP